MSHHVEVFKDDRSGLWGWSCFNPLCHDEETGYEDFETAEDAAGEHGGES